MPSEYKFTADQRFRLVDADPKLVALFQRKSLKGQALDEFVARECLPAFFQHTVNAFKGIEIKRFPVKFIRDGKKPLDANFSLKPVFHKDGSFKALKGSISISQESVDCLNLPSV